MNLLPLFYLVLVFLFNLAHKIRLDNTRLATPYDRFDALSRDDIRLEALLPQDAKFVVIVSPQVQVEKRALVNPLTIPYSKRSLFQKYVFFSPAVFMGIFSSLIVLGIALIGVSALTSLQTPTRFDTIKKGDK